MRPELTCVCTSCSAWRVACVVCGRTSSHVLLPSWLLFLRAPEFVNASPAAGETDISQLADRTFLENASEELKGFYQTVVTEASQRLAPSIRVFNPTSVTTPGEFLLLVAFRTGTTHSLFTGVSDVYRYYDLFALEKFVEPMSNGIVVYAFHLGPLGSTPRPRGGSSVTAELIRDCSLHYVLPKTSLTPMLSRGILSVQQVAYAYAAWKFAFHFLSRESAEIANLSAELGKNTKGIQALAKIRKSLQTHAFTEGAIMDSFFRNPEAITVLYQDFCARHQPGSSIAIKAEVELAAFLKRSVTSEQDLQVFNSVYMFNRKILKTNFFKTVKIGLSFRFDPTFLSRDEYPEIPFGLFMAIGAEFRGFHVRFRDVARGGIRIVRSPNLQAYASNVNSMFEENFNLAYTQQRKNKDIPEGGSKGVILLSLAHQDKIEVAFHKYVDSILDIILPTDEIVDHLGKEEILFFGPDENTADVMDWACLHSKSRGYKFWKAFTTGKSPSLGGIPHDKYGMTTHGVRQYALGIQAKLGLLGSSCTKVQTGGPDGDLGSNEILMGNERTTAIVDGSGVLYDPHGIDQAELERLARGRKMVKFVNPAKISPDGKLVLVEDKDVVLPDGTLVESGMAFRNNFHLSHLSRGDFFIPCGGRPAAVTVDMAHKFAFLPDGSLRFKYVVEGANLFFTQQAREVIEKAGVIVFKDASANKGGVTSSSLEVLAALTLRDDEFAKHMAVPTDPDADVPEFYQEYVREVQAKIDENAQLEFECLWKEHARTGVICVFWCLSRCVRWFTRVVCVGWQALLAAH
jgi:glutamate dehydrogenase